MDETIRAYLSEIGRKGTPAWRQAPRDCAHCGVVIPAARGRRQYCSPSCRYRAWYARHQAAEEPA